MVDASWTFKGKPYVEKVREYQEKYGVEITIIDDSDYVGWAASATRLEEIHMYDVETMVNNVLKRAAIFKINRLNILDHGNESSIQVGKDWISLGNIEGYRKTLSRLKGHFHRNGFVHLQHCNIGQNQQLLIALSKMWGVPVYAGTGKHNPVYRINFGDYVKCLPDARCIDNAERP